MNSNLDTRLHDHVALAEIELYSELLTAVAATEGRLSTEQIDAVLGVLPQRRAGDSDAHVPLSPEPRRRRGRCPQRSRR
ncbi:hypothetical protein ACQEU5_09895 [Marinactinospora thermotolerans]|uniref:Uncharacterized protein n=1 Tax=Marinactinospora thermotolerans DSM 45154 TaxID=1122192 RepID=A0A1T4N881_9ACTN|nr:hypothetical protein [Marinactinospora thermotolerans]SJZ75306.1 hypothetical protein SAMN02745673_01318 [Marinactinospora thermotolerans DSM 45154]